ncbi:glycoside hydrolase family 3 N-terminal domain-containing protein [Colwellia maritima]|uniref:glycoside hydrolase family 3 N-terminal domain-containing protein n=1 Tax=Colwellia maritima TaxID=2912588 RepID=UPI00237A6584|nr:glycoside hydrolase family 3 N-terminal domain-containing protein [Colwellia maritima]
MKVKALNNSLKLIVVFFCFTYIGNCFSLPNNYSSQPFSGNNVSNKPMTNAKESSSFFSDLEKQIAAKIALDIRYYCTDSANSKKGTCLQPVTKLPVALAEMITKSGIGSVVLFAENLVSTKQVIQLTHDLQKAAVQSDSGLPLIISIDQEGGGL